jgi:hypothetical protein
MSSIVDIYYVFQSVIEGSKNKEARRRQTTKGEVQDFCWNYKKNLEDQGGLLGYCRYEMAEYLHRK